jgi:F-type H+-transporting ATPase subunit gamma
MESLSVIKDRIKTVGSIAKATNAIKMVATVKLSKANSLYRNAGECASALLDMLSIAVSEARFNGTLESDSWIERKDGKTLVLVLSTDQGFCGAFNQSITEAANRLMSESNADYVEVFGKKGANISRSKRNKGKEENIERNVSMHLDPSGFAKMLSEMVTEYVTNRDVSKVVIVSGEKKNSMVQVAKRTDILPLNINNAVNSGYTAVEGDVQSFINDVFKMYTNSLFKSLVAKHLISEFSARIIAMDNSVRNANDMSDKLSVFYNNIRQAKITQELTEIVSSMECVQ